MRILQLCKKNPYPPKDGEAIAINTITQGLSQAGHQLTVLVINTPKHQFNIQHLPAAFKQNTTYDAVFIDTKIKAFDALKNLFSNKSYNIERFHHKKYEDLITEYLKTEKFDVVHLEGVYLATYIKLIKQLTDAPIVMRAHNVESEIWERLAQEAKHPLKKIYLSFLAKRMKQFEQRMIHYYDGLVCISKKDEQYFKQSGYVGPSFTLAASINKNDYVVKKEEAQPNTLFFIGSLDWMPNQKGMLWFLQEVWPKLLQAHPLVTLYIAGRNIPDWFVNLDAQRVHIVGEVENAKAFMRSKGIMIVPLFSGSGMRIKIIEAMALAKPMVVTSIAAEGINYTNGVELAIANNADVYFKQLLKLLNSHHYRNNMEKAARAFILKEHETKTLIERLIQFYKTLIPNVQ